MSLSATPDGRWHYEPAPRLFPPHTPYPRHHQTDWLAYAATHSDAWLVALTFHNGAPGSPGLGRPGRPVCPHQ